ncbi:MAG: leucine-rich repeat protein [Bacilli bacterium]
MKLNKKLSKKKSVPKLLYIILGILIGVVIIGLSSFFIVKNVSKANKNNSLKEFYGLEFNDATYKYDGKNKKIYVENQPEFSTISYSCTLDDGTIVYKNYFSEPGVYKIDATIEKENYRTTTISATLRILKAYKINFHLNETTIIPLEVFEGENLKTSLIPSVEPKTGKVGKWSINSFQNIQSNMDVYPIYEDALYSITYFLDGGEIMEEYTRSFYALEIAQNPIELPIPSKEGYYFDGWYSDSSFKNAIDCINIPMSYVLYAKWKKDELALKYEIIGDHAVVLGIDEEYEESHNSIVIPDLYENYPVTEIAANAFAFVSDLLYVTIGNNVKKIGDNAFKSCGKLLKVTMSESVEEIGSYCFAYCFNLEKIDLPNSIVQISEGMFKYCQSLKQILLPESICMICDQAFTNCSKLEYILYLESKDSFRLISIECELNYIVCFYSEELSYDGENHYWCYNQDGLIIIK